MDLEKCIEKNLPKIDLITFGFPCQDLSIAGKRGGLSANRSGLFFKAIEIIEAKKPKYFIFENVKGIFSSNGGKDFDVVLRTISNIGYDGQWELCNTRWYLPQNRERIYFVGHIRGESRPKVFPLGESDEKIKDIQGQYTNTLKARYEAIGDGSYIIEGELNAQKKGLNQIANDTTCAKTIKNGGGMGAKAGLYKIPEATSKGYSIAEEGDSINLSQPASKTRRGRVGKGVAQTLDTGMQQYTIQSGIRRLTPTECERLQGFPDGWTDEQSDTQRYKQLGNAVSVPVVKAIMERLYKGESNAK